MYGGTSGIHSQFDTAGSVTKPALQPNPDVLRYIYLVRVKTSVTLPADLLDQLDRVDKNRSALLERAARAYLTRLQAEQRESRDLEIINRNAERLNREAADTMEYQQLP